MAKVEMHVPNKSYEGYYGGVKFVKGVGLFEDVELAKELAKRYGYEIVEIAGEEVKPEVIEEVKEVEVKPEPKKRTRKAKAGE